MSVRIDAKPAVQIYTPPAWATEVADRDLALLITRGSAPTRPQLFNFNATGNIRPKSPYVIRPVGFGDNIGSPRQARGILSEKIDSVGTRAEATDPGPLNRSIIAIVVLFIVYMAAQFIRAWLEGWL